MFEMGRLSALFLAALLLPASAQAQQAPTPPSPRVLIQTHL